MAVYGAESQLKVSSARIFITGLDGSSIHPSIHQLKAPASAQCHSLLPPRLPRLGIEIAKNVCLAGVAEVAIHDSTRANMMDQNANFYIDRAVKGDSAGRLPGTRAELSYQRLKALNPAVKVSSRWLY